MVTSEKKKITAFEEELIKAATKVREYKLACEANIVSIFYREPNIIYDYELKLEDFSENIWRVYWQIAYDIVVKEQKSVLDEITVGLYLEKHDKLKAKYNEYGGYDTINKAKEFVNVKNIDGYIKELHKWITVLMLLKNRFPVYDKISDFADMTLDEVYAEYDALLNHIFINADGESKSYSIEEGIDELIDDLNKGMAIGLPYSDMSMLNKETGGQLIGNITLVGGLSNVGKTALSRIMTIPSIIKNKEKLVIMINEESVKKWQRELLVYVANNIYKYDLQKFVVRDGSYTDETMSILRQSAQWIKDKAANHIITVIPFKSYTTSKAIRVIKKYSSLGCKYFILDTFKADSGCKSENTWLQMQQSMVDINDTIKAEVKNVHILITFQLNKSSARQRFYTQDNVGMAKSIIDTASTCIMIRDLFEDEYSDGSHALKVYRLDGKNKKSKIPVDLDRDKHYQILFIVKNREGAANQYQVVIESDLSRNVIKEVGLTSVPVDF